MSLLSSNALLMQFIHSFTTLYTTEFYASCTKDTHLFLSLIPFFPSMFLPFFFLYRIPFSFLPQSLSFSIIVSVSVSTVRVCAIVSNNININVVIVMAATCPAESWTHPRHALLTCSAHAAARPYICFAQFPAISALIYFKAILRLYRLLYEIDVIYRKRVRVF